MRFQISEQIRELWNLRFRLLLVLCLLVTGCRTHEGDGAPLARDAAAPRIVSLSPAISRALADLDVVDHVVGRTPFCTAVPERVAVAGDHAQADYERIIRLRPTHLLVQRPAGGVDPELERLAREHGWTLGSWPLNDIDDVRAMVLELPAAIDPDDAALAAHADELAAQLAAAVEPVAEPVYSGRVLLVCGVQPICVFGGETYMDDLLTALGAVNAAADRRGWPELTLEDVARLDPEAIVIVVPAPPPAPDAAAAAGPLASLPVEAVRRGRIAVIADPDAFLPSTGLLRVAERLRAVLADFDGTPP